MIPATGAAMTLRNFFAFAALGLLLALFAATPKAHAFNEQIVLPCVFKQALALLTCKTHESFSYVGMREGVYVFNVHFGAKNTEFYAQVFDNFVIFTSKAWKGRMASAGLIYDYGNGCVTASLKPLPCSLVREAKCCSN